MFNSDAEKTGIREARERNGPERTTHCMSVLVSGRIYADYRCGILTNGSLVTWDNDCHLLSMERVHG